MLFHAPKLSASVYFPIRHGSLARQLSASLICGWTPVAFATARVRRFVEVTGVAFESKSDRTVLIAF